MDSFTPPPDWQGDQTAITRTFTFPDFAAAMRFVNQLADHAERVDHHPDIDIRYHRVVVRLTSHDTGRVTQRDLRFARTVNSWL